MQEKHERERAESAGLAAGSLLSEEGGRDTPEHEARGSTLDADERSPPVRAVARGASRASPSTAECAACALACSCAPDLPDLR